MRAWPPRSPLRARRGGRRDDHAQRPRHAQRALAGAARRADRGASSAPATTTAVRCVVLRSSHEKTFSSGANLGGFAADVPLVHKHFASERFVDLFKLIGELGKPTIVRGARARARGRARDRAGVRSDRRLRARELRHARDQHRHVPVHDHGADLPQRPAQEGQRAAAARRALERAGGARGGDRQQGRARRRSSTRPSTSGRASSRASRR